jgi:hypothetical protein
MNDGDGRMGGTTLRIPRRLAGAAQALGGRVRSAAGWPISYPLIPAMRTAPVRAAIARRSSSWLLLADGRPSLIATRRRAI